MADRVPRETGGKAEGASHKVLRLGQRDGRPPGLGERMRGGDQIAPSGFPLYFVTLIPDLTCVLRFSGRRGLRKIDGRVRSVREASPTARIEGTLNDCQLAATTRERGLLSQLPPLMLTCFNEVKVYLPMYVAHAIIQQI